MKKFNRQKILVIILCVVYIISVILIINKMMNKCKYEKLRSEYSADIDENNNIDAKIGFAAHFYEPILNNFNVNASITNIVDNENGTYYVEFTYKDIIGIGLDEEKRENIVKVTPHYCKAIFDIDFNMLSVEDEINENEIHEERLKY